MKKPSKKAKSKEVKVKEALSILKLICNAFDCAFDTHVSSDIRHFSDGKELQIKSYGEQDIWCELLVKRKLKTIGEEMYDSVILDDENDQSSYRELEYATADSTKSIEDALVRLASKLSGKTLMLDKEKEPFARIPKFNSLSELKMKLAIEGKI